MTYITPWFVAMYLFVECITFMTFFVWVFISFKATYVMIMLFLQGTFTTNCPGKMVYYYHHTSCKKTCRSLSESDHTCSLSHTPVDGCGCPKDTYLNDMNVCVSSDDCPCYVDSEVVGPKQVISKDGTTW